MFHDFSVLPLSLDHFEERVLDICESVKAGVYTTPIFSMTLVPEGNPVWDKVGKLAKIYCRYRDRLLEFGIESAILVQSSLGHGYPITPNPFLRYVNLTDGEEPFVCCPLDENFIEHFSGVLRTLAALKPAAIMLDDDFRLMMRPGYGCACARHMAEFNRRAGLNMSRAELYRHLTSHKKEDRLSRIFAETQRDSLIKAAKAFRGAIDSVDASIQGINCTSGNICESVEYTNKIFAGKGNPTMVRIPNGIYAPINVRGFSDLMRQSAVCKSKLRHAGIDIILSETDTIPFNRYAKSARYLHSHYTASMLDGLCGAKHWLTRMSAYEPRSGAAYREILAKHRGMYEKLSELSDKIRWVGAASAFVEQFDYDFSSPEKGRHHTNVFAEKVFERMGIPFFYSDEKENAAFLEGDIVSDLSNKKIEELFRGSVFLDGYSAKMLCERGFGHLLGVSVTEWDLGTVTQETFDGTLHTSCTKQKNHKKLTVTDEKTEVLSHNCLRQDGKAKLLAPAVTVLERAEGKITAVFSGSPDAEFDYTEGFAFLNETRKSQLISLLRRAGALPVYVDGDAEICLRAGLLPGGELLLAIFELGIDPLEELPLFLEKTPESIEIMLPDGSFAPVIFKKSGENLYTLNVRVEPLYPVILKITFSKINIL